MKKSLLIIGMIVALAAFSVQAIAIMTQEKKSTLNPNLPLKTLGGKQIWQDEVVYAGWRVQRNVVTGHHRLLDDKNVRHAWGSREDCLVALNAKRQEKALAPQSTHLVILIHGIARGPGTFGKMPQALRDAGYDVAAISYPSTRATIETHAEELEALLDAVEGATEVSFITHSMGGLVLRHMLAKNDIDERAWRARLSVIRVIQIAPPNQGSAMARILADNPLYAAAYGKAGQQLTPDLAAAIPDFDVPFALIIGGKSDGKGFSPILPGDDDGTVAVTETYLEGAVDQLTLPVIHAMISADERTISAIVRYMEHGSFGEILTDEKQ